MGGKNPLDRVDDADLNVAVNIAVNGAFFQAGQRCTSSSRLIVTEGIHDEFVAAMVERIKKLVIDDALKPGIDIGPVVDARQLEKNLSYVEIGKKEGAKLVHGGERLKRDTDGFYMAPALFTETTNEHAAQSRGSVRPGRRRDSREGLRRGARGGQRHAVRSVVGHRDDVAQATRVTSSATRRADW